MTTISAHTLSPAKGSTHSSKRVGRGNASGKGTTAARGTKGQRARTGGRRGIRRRAFRQQLLKIPKLRGFRSIHEKKEVVTLKTLERVAVENTNVTPAFLARRGVIATAKNGVKIVATGTLTKKLTIRDCVVSKGAIAAIEKTGGKVIF